MYSPLLRGVSHGDVPVYRWQVCYKVDMYVARIPNRGSPPAILLRESYRQGGKVKTRTLANLSHWPEPKVDALAQTLKGLPPKLDLSQAFEITAACRTGMSRRCWAPHVGSAWRSSSMPRPRAHAIW